MNRPKCIRGVVKNLLEKCSSHIVKVRPDEDENKVEV